MDELRGKNQPARERVEHFDPPTGTCDDSSIEDTGVRIAPDKQRARNLNVLVIKSKIRRSDFGKRTFREHF